MNVNFEISDEAWEKALERHEDNWKKELKEVDIKAVVLKTKKAVLEQARINSRTHRAVSDLDFSVKQNSRKVEAFSRRIEELEADLEKTKALFAKAVEIMEQKELEKENKKSFFSKFWDFLKCLMK